MEIDYIKIAFSIGIISGFHCLGMCGPIAFSLGLSAENKFKFYGQNLIYQFGRITTYTLFGGIIGVFGEGFNLSGYQNQISIFSGIMLILMVIIPKITTYFQGKFVFLDRFLIRLKIKLGIFLQQKSTTSRYITGILNGFLPCGAVYVALTASLASGGILNGMSFMFIFGLGTVPFMFMAVILGNVIGSGIRNTLLKMYPFLIVIFGILFIIRGLELNIPHLSPDEGALQLHPSKECCK